jgi:hypothetical protein
MSEPSRGLTRRQLFGGAAGLAALSTIARVPDVLAARGLLPGLDGAPPPPGPDVVRDTLAGLVAFVVPGPDPYSRAQGEWSETPGGIAAGTVQFMVDSLDGYLPGPDGPGPLANDVTLPLSQAVAVYLNALALQVNPAAAGGLLLSPFARLSAAEKAEVFRRMEELDLPDDGLPEPFTAASGNLRFIAGALVEFVAFGTYSEWHAFDPEARTLRERPVGWHLTGYQPDGPVEGWDEGQRYFQGRTEVTG